MVKYRFSIAFYKKGWLKTVSFTYNKQDCFDIEKGRNKRKVTGYRKCESLSFYNVINLKAEDIYSEMD